VAKGTTPECRDQFVILGLVATGFGNTILPSVLQSIHMPNVVWKDIERDEK
jgi:hypothetical protein